MNDKYKTINLFDNYGDLVATYYDVESVDLSLSGTTFISTKNRNLYLRGKYIARVAKDYQSELKGVIYFKLSKLMSEHDYGKAIGSKRHHLYMFVKEPGKPRKRKLIKSFRAKIILEIYNFLWVRKYKKATNKLRNAGILETL